MASAFDVPDNPIATTLTHTNRISFLSFPMRDYAAERLDYGVRYKVRETVTANGTGWLSEGEVVTFLGFYSFPHDNGLRFYFEDDERQKFVLEFEGNMPDLEVITMWTPQMTRDYLAREPDTPRALELQALARAIVPLAGTVAHKDPQAEE